jgi:signal transduction histidine kinase
MSVSGAASDGVRPAPWFHPTGAQLNWLLRLVELPVVLLVVWLPTHSIGSPLTTGSLALASAAWIGWLGLSHWRVRGSAAGRALWPVLLVIAAAGGIAAASALSGRDTGGSTAVALSVIVALDAGTTLRPWTALTVTSAGVLGVLAGLLILGGLSAWRTGITDSLLIVGGAVGGVARGLRVEQLRQSKLLLAQQTQAQETREQAATLAERGRIARDIHDVLAHSLADLSIQLEVADALLSDSGDSSGALRHVRRAHRLTADGLEEVRRVVHALQSDTPALPDAVTAMTGAYRDDGGEARFDLLGAPRPLPPAVGLALIRTAGEAMANARKHAAGRPVTVVLRFDDDRVALTVADRGDQRGADDDGATGRQSPAPDGVGGGYCLAGMSERLRLVGGSLTAGPSAGGWRVHAEVPA